MITLRPYQRKFIRDVQMDFHHGSRAVLGVSPTGSGKTVMFSYMAREIVKAGRRVLVLAHRVELIKQISAAFTMFGVYHGIQNPKFRPDYTAAAQVGSIQTVANRLHRNKPFDYIILDEAHHATASTWRDVLAAFPDSKVLGVTATPCRGDGIGLGREAGGIFDSMVLGPSVQDLIDIGFLSPPKILAAKDQIDFSRIRTVAGDYDRSQQAKLMDKKSITGSAVSHYLQHLPGKRAIAFCVNVVHAEHVAAEFAAAGIPAISVDGKMDPDKRAAVFGSGGMFDSGEIQVVTSCDLISEGFDLPAVEGAILLRKTQSTGLYLQQVGRALRPSPGKSEAIILDHVGNYQMHGGPHWDRSWTLDGETRAERKEKQEQTEPMRQCEKCFACYDPQPVCPYCGHCKAVEMPRFREGQLVEVDGMTDRERAAEAKAERQRKKEAYYQRKAAELRPVFEGKSGDELRRAMEEASEAARSGAQLFAIAKAAGLKNTPEKKHASAWVFRRSKQLGIQLGRK